MPVRDASDELQPVSLDVLRMLRGESAERLSRGVGLPIFKLEQWRRKADAALNGALTPVSTVQHGKVLAFGVAEHGGAECLGWHGTKRGTRFEVTPALAMAVREPFRHPSAPCRHRHPPGECV